MSLQLSDINHLLTLSHLSCTETEKETYLGQLQNILGHINVLKGLPLNDQEGEKNSGSTLLRDDVVLPKHDLHLNNIAPAWENGCFRVPKILES
jgi:aspartyl/glutamyl-tRNA(Asn/Gln) amidotransferase C subunit